MRIFLYRSVFTYDDSHFTALIVKSAGHHGADRVVHHRHDVCFIVLKPPHLMFNSKTGRLICIVYKNPQRQTVIWDLGTNKKI